MCNLLTPLWTWIQLSDVISETWIASRDLSLYANYLSLPVELMKELEEMWKWQGSQEKKGLDVNSKNGSASQLKRIDKPNQNNG